MKKFFILMLTIIMVVSCSVTVSAFDFFWFKILPAPEHVSAVIINYEAGNPGGITVTFDEVDGADYYNVIFYGENIWDIHVIKTEADTLKFLETHCDWFDCDVDYTISVQAVSGYSYGIPSKPISITKVTIPEFRVPIYI